MNLLEKPPADQQREGKLQLCGALLSSDLFKNFACFQIYFCFPLSLLSSWCIFKYSLSQIHCQRTLRNVLVDSGMNRALDPPHSGLIPSECESQSWTPSPPLWKASSQPASLLRLPSLNQVSLFKLFLGLL